MNKNNFTKIKYIKNGLHTLYSVNCPFECEYEDTHSSKHTRKVGSPECLTCIFFITKHKDTIECSAYVKGFDKKRKKNENS